MKNINLYEILKGHEGEIFYCPFYGDVKLDYVNENEYLYDYNMNEIYKKVLDKPGNKFLMRK